MHLSTGWGVPGIANNRKLIYIYHFRLHKQLTWSRVKPNLLVSPTQCKQSRVVLFFNTKYLTCSWNSKITVTGFLWTHYTSPGSSLLLLYNLLSSRQNLFSHSHAFRQQNRCHSCTFILSLPNNPVKPGSQTGEVILRVGKGEKRVKSRICVLPGHWSMCVQSETESWIWSGY